MDDKLIDMKSTKRSAVLQANFVDGFAEGWYMAIKECFKMELDIKFTERKKNKITYFEWTQGPYYCFSEGQIFYDAMEGYYCWKDALKEVNLACQIIAAKPNTSLKYDNDVNGKTEFKIMEGYVHFSLFKPDEARSKLVPFVEHTLSQNDFVSFLKTGEIKGEK
jgi:hypothetical protein